MKKRLCAVLASGFMIVIFLLASLTAMASTPLEGTTPLRRYVMAIDDRAHLFKNEKEVKTAMEPVTEYVNYFIVTNPKSNLYLGSTAEYAKGQLQAMCNRYRCSYAHSAIFLIDMYKREIYIWSGDNAYLTLTTDWANNITDNVYREAKRGNYDACAIKTSQQIYSVFAGEPVRRPMKYICSALLAIAAGLTLCYVVMQALTGEEIPSQEEIREGMGIHWVRVSDDHVKLLSRVFVHNSSGGDSSSSGGGGGGSSGGGGGGGGGGGHSF